MSFNISVAHFSLAVAGSHLEATSSQATPRHRTAFASSSSTCTVTQQHHPFRRWTTDHLQLQLAFSNCITNRPCRPLRSAACHFNYQRLSLIASLSQTIPTTVTSPKPVEADTIPLLSHQAEIMVSHHHPPSSPLLLLHLHQLQGPLDHGNKALEVRVVVGPNVV